MEEKTATAIGLASGGVAFGVIEAFYLSYNHFHVDGRDAFGFGVMSIIGGLGVAALLASLLITIHSLWTEYGKAFFSFGTRVAIAVWRIAITVAVVYLGAKQLGINFGK